MTPFMTVLALACLPGIANVIGGMLAEKFPPKPKLLSDALHMAAGILFAVVAVEIVPRTLAAHSGFVLAAAVSIGGILYLAADAGVSRLVARGEGDDQTDGDEKKRAWMIYGAVSMDLLSDGVLIGAGTAIAPEVGLVLALGQIVADVPEGFAAMATFKAIGLSKAHRLLLTFSFMLPILVSAVLSYLFLRDEPESTRILGLAVVGGILLVTAVEDLHVEAHETSPGSVRSTASMIFGFVLFTLVSSWFGA